MHMRADALTTCAGGRGHHEKVWSEFADNAKKSKKFSADLSFGTHLELFWVVVHCVA